MNWKHLYERNIDIVLLNETHLKSKYKFRIQNDYTYRNDRTDGPMGGTAICVKKDIGHRVVNIPNLQFIEISGILLPISNNQEIFYLKISTKIAYTSRSRHYYFYFGEVYSGWRLQC